MTGGAGFIGSHLVDDLVTKGHDVCVIDSLEPQVHRAKPSYLNQKARYDFRDIREPRVLPKALKGIDVVFHLAARVGVGQSMYEISRYVDANAGGTGQLLQAVVDGKPRIKKLIVASSMSIYGEGAYACKTHGTVSPPLRPESQLRDKDWEVRCPTCNEIVTPIPTGESKPLNTNSVYAVTKRDQEELCLATGRAYGIPTVALRFFNVYGPRQSLDNPYTGVCAIFQSRIKNGQPPVIFEDGKQTRDLVSVHDIVRACILAMERRGANYEAVNVGSGRPVSIHEVAQVLLNLYGSVVRPKVAHTFRAGDVRHCFADLTKIRKLLGYEPTARFELGMKELVAWGQSVKAKDRFDDAMRELRSKGLVEG